MKIETSIIHARRLRLSEFLFDAPTNVAKSDVGDDLVDTISFTSMEAVTRDENRQFAFNAAATFANKALHFSGFKAYIFVTEVAKESKVPLWERYEQQWGLALISKGPILETTLPNWFRTYSIGMLAGDSIDSAKAVIAKKASFVRLFFSLPSASWGSAEIEQCHAAAYRPVAGEIGTPVTIRDSCLAQYLISRHSILLRHQGIEGSTGYTFEFMMAPQDSPPLL